ncbi:MAG: hypothetical protein IJS22_02755 [Lachnospiraceae bacterium]|nr:hypothetical protein [Lachnospiraceae bacterium]
MYERILNNTIEELRKLPTPVPAKGRLAGFGREYSAPDGPMFTEDNYHYPMGTSYLKSGVAGVSQRAAVSAMKAEDPRNRELLEAISVVYGEVAAWIRRYSESVLQEAGSDDRIRRIGENLSVIASRAPEHFDQALQLVYLMWKIRCLNKPGADIGRLDVHLRKWYEDDISSGYTTDEEVLSELCDFWELLNTNDSGDTLINVMVGGMNPDGSDAGSRLSVLMLEATKRCRKTEPHINVRVHPKLHPDIRRAMLEVQLMGHGQATMYNDEVVIPGLIAFGVPEELAYTYTNDGCTEIMLDGNSGIEFAHVDVVAAFELAFNNGEWAPRTYRKKVSYWNKAGDEHYYTPDCVTGFESGRIEDCSSFEEFYQQFLDQYRFQVRNKCSFLKRMEDDRLAGGVSSVFLNGTYDFVIESGLDIMRGGFPFADYMMFAGSIPTAADCLTAVKELVFDKKEYSVAEIKEAIRVNFEGYEVMRQKMLAAPKFGNDLDEVDELAADIARHFCDWLDEYRRMTGFGMLPALLGWRFLEEAYGIAATPDGRRYGDPIAEHYCATPGKATHGPTALIASISKAKDSIARSIGVCPVHMTLPGNLGSSYEENIDILDKLGRAAFESGLNQMNIAIYDTKLLREAQKDPENHQDLIIRVWGYSARFVDLCTEMQEHVISRVARSA